MEILILNWKDIKNPHKGGAEIILYEMAKRLVRSGHGVTWFSQGYKEGAKEDNFQGIRIIRRGNKYSVYFHALLYYLRMKKKPDLVLDCVNTICWQTPLYVERNKRIFYTNQSAREVFFCEYKFPISLIGYLLEPLQYFTYKNTKTICYSRSIKNDLLSFGIPKQNINLFPLGVDHSRYKRGVKAKKPLFIFVARFVKNKRPDLCIKAMRKVIDKYPLAKLFLVGYGKEEVKLRSLIKKLELNSNVKIANKNNTYLKKDNRDIKIKLMQEAWALLLPSVKEGWGMVVTEAAACGTPAIVTDVTGLKDSVIANKTGLIIGPNPTEEELAEAIIKLIGNHGLRKSLSLEAIRNSRNFDWNKSFDVFKRLISPRF